LGKVRGCARTKGRQPEWGYEDKYFVLNDNPIESEINRGADKEAYARKRGHKGGKKSQQRDQPLRKGLARQSAGSKKGGEENPHKKVTTESNRPQKGGVGRGREKGGSNGKLDAVLVLAFYLR